MTTIEKPIVELLNVTCNLSRDYLKQSSNNGI